MAETNEDMIKAAAGYGFGLLITLILFNYNVFTYKVRLTLQSFLYLVFCSDKSWQKPDDPSTYFNKEGVAVEKKRIVFIRHGESTWNETFNKGSHRSALVFAIGYIPNLIRALFVELYLLITGKIDSWFYDAPLSELGLTQADSLAKFINTASPTTDKEKEILGILRGDEGAASSQLYSSNLRRALATIASAFNQRLSRRPKDNIIVLPSLQEISRNPDTLAITPAHTPVKSAWIEASSTICDFQSIYSDRCDMSIHSGNKPLNTNGLKRMIEFCNYAFTQAKDVDVLICGGHSIWFRSFFKTFLPYESIHVSKTRKIVNGGTVAFTLMKTVTESGSEVYMIDEKSILVIYGGF